ncbi:MAG: transposase [Pyrinomonadaceae bacterium]|nr:transposase [Pyrinomonadaceae bacterium]
MKLTLQTQLFPNTEQAKRLKDTLIAFNNGCSWLAVKAFELKCANKIELQKLYYYELKEKFRLSAQMTVRAIAQTVEAYKRDKTICPKFREFAAMPFDQRMMSFKGVDTVSLLTLEGRIRVPFVIGKYQTERFSNAKGQADLVYRVRDGEWFLLVTVDIPDGASLPTTDFIGIDLGICELATTSDGESFSGDDVKNISKKYALLRQNLQHKASCQIQSGKRPRSIRRFQKRISKKVRNYKKYINYCISKKLVQTATDTCRALVLEDLTGIRKRCEQRFRKSERPTFSGWSFFELRKFIEYKSKLAGIPVVLVNPKNTSRECFACGHIAKENRKSQSDFECVNCRHKNNADINAAKIIARRASVSIARSSESLEFQYSS